MNSDAAAVAVLFSFILIVCAFFGAIELTPGREVGTDVLIHNARRGFVYQIRVNDDAKAELSAAGPKFFSIFSDESKELYYAEERKEIPLGITWEKYFSIEPTNIKSTTVEIMEGTFSLEIESQSMVTVDFWPTKGYIWAVIGMVVAMWLAIILLVTLIWRAGW